MTSPPRRVASLLRRDDTPVPEASGPPALDLDLNQETGSTSDAGTLSTPDGQGHRLEGLLRELGSAVQRGDGPGLAAPPLASGIDAVDRMLGGGFPVGRVCEVAGPASSGRTSLGLALLARVTGAGAFAAWVDAADAFDPPSAAAAGVDLSRVLWVRPGEPEHALQGAEQVLKAGGFALAVIDLARDGERRERPLPAASGPRLRRCAAGAGAALLVLSRQRRLGAAADLALEMGRAQVRFEAGPSWLASLDARARLVRNRTGPGDRQAPVRFALAERAA